MTKHPGNWTDRIEEVLSVGLFVLLIVLCVLQVVFRFVLNFSLSWTEELARYTFILLTYVACSLGVLKGAHVRVEIIDSFVTGKYKYLLDQGIDLVWGAFVFCIGYLAIDVTREAFAIGKTTPALDWQIGWMYAIIPATFILMALRLLQRMMRRHSLWVEKHEHL